MAEIDKEKGESGLPKVLATDEIQRSRPGGCYIKNVRQLLFPSLPEGPIHSQEHTSEIATREQSMKQWAVSTEVQKPYEFEIPEGDTRAEPGLVDEQPVSHDIAVVITEQPQKPADDPFMGKRQRESSSESESKKRWIDKEDMVMYRDIPMSRQMVNILNKQKEDEIAAKVHESCKTSKAPKEHDYSQNPLDADDCDTLPGLAEDTEIATQGARKEKIHTTRMVNSTGP